MHYGGLKTSSVRSVLIKLAVPVDLVVQAIPWCMFECMHGFDTCSSANQFARLAPAISARVFAFSMGVKSG
jgi:hypothetical protein